MTTTATERPTLSNAEQRALAVGTRVEVKRYASDEWLPGVIADPSEGNSTSQPLVRFDEGVTAGWVRNGRHHWHIAGSDTHAVRLADDPVSLGTYAFGDRVQWDPENTGTIRSGVIRARYTGAGAGPENASWLVCSDDLPTGWPVYASNHRGDGRPEAFTYAPDFSSDGERGTWVRENLLTRVPESPEDTSEVSQLRARVAEAESMFRTIGEALADTADRSEWCGEYESKLDRLVSVLPAGTFRDVFSDAAHRDREYTVRVEFTVSGSTYVTVSAPDAERAEELVREDPFDYIDTYSARSGLDVGDAEIDSVEVE